MALGAVADRPLGGLTTEEPERPANFRRALLEQLERPLHVFDALVGHHVHGIGPGRLTALAARQNLYRTLKSLDDRRNGLQPNGARRLL